MSKEITQQQSQDEEQKQQLEAFRKQLGVTDTDRFWKAVKFCELTIDGGNLSKVYSDVFEVPIEKARTLASQFHRSKWVQELILFLRPDEQSLYFGERKKIIQRGMEIINDKNASNRDVTEAIKALQPYLKQEKLEHEIKLNASTAGQALQASISGNLQHIAETGRMIDKAGNIIDVDIIE